MKSYGQYCSIARALDVVGDRWTLLIIRELLQRGPSRFTDLKNGLPGIAPNLLSGRLKDLEDAGLMMKEEAPPPVATTLYQLTDSGLALEPVLKALGLWGMRYMAEERPGDVFQAHWLAAAPAWFSTDAEPDAPPAVIQLVSADEQAVLEIGGGQVRARIGRVADPDLLLDGPPRTILGVLFGLVDTKAASKIGLTIRGRRDVLARLRPPTPA